MRNWTNILTMLLRLRQGEWTAVAISFLLYVRLAITNTRAHAIACDHPILVTKPDESAPELEAPAQEEEVDELADMLGGMGVEGGAKCNICFTK